MMRSSRWTLFRNRSFLFYWLGYLLSHVGDSVFLIAAAWLVADVTGSGWMMGAYFMCLGIPRVLLMLVGGVFVDRMEPRTWMLLSDGLRGVVMILFYLLIVDGTPSVWGLYVIAVLFGTVDAVYWPAANKLRQRVVARENYSQANGVLVGSMQMAMIAGPVLGAALLALGGTGLAVLFNGISFFVSALTLFFVTLQPLPGISPGGGERGGDRKGRKSFWADLLEGLRFVWQSPVLLTMIVVSFCANAGANSVSVGLPFIARSLDVGANGLAHMSSAWGVGGVVGALLLSLIVIQYPTPMMVLFSFLLQGLAILGIGFMDNHWQVAGLLVVCGVASAGIQVFLSSVNQTIIPPEIMGRVSSVMTLVSMGSTPFAQGIAGFSLDALGVRDVYVGAGVIVVVASLLAFVVPQVREYRQRTFSIEAGGYSSNK